MPLPPRPPPPHDPIELYTQLTILNKNHLFGKKSVYKEMFCGKKNKANLRQLNFLLNQHCYYRRTKQEVLKDLPAKTRQVILCEITNREEYTKAENDFRKFIESQLTLSSGQIDRKLRAEALTKMMELKKLAARGKLHAVKEWAESMRDAGEKAVLFGYHKDINQSMISFFPGTVAILSQQDTPMEVIQKNKEKFQNDPSTMLIVCSISAAAEGHTLTAASNLGMVELPWHFGKAEQIEDRIHRIGQYMPVTIAYFLADHTIDRKIYNLIMDKKEMHDGITGTDDQVEEKIIDKMISLFTS
jgi:SWI/SNF-related matrix-associated actin-dependent regulator of chromatin subfamily A-like protein 1